MAQWKQIQLGIMRLWVRSLSLASFGGLRIQRCCELKCRPAATALIRPLAWEPPYVAGVAQKKEKEKEALSLNRLKSLKKKNQHFKT